MRMKKINKNNCRNVSPGKSLSHQRTLLDISGWRSLMLDVPESEMHSILRPGFSVWPLTIYNCQYGPINFLSSSRPLLPFLNLHYNT